MLKNLSEPERLKIASLINELSKTCNEVESLKSELSKNTSEKENLTEKFKQLFQENLKYKSDLDKVENDKNDEILKLQNKLSEMYIKLKNERKKLKNEHENFEKVKEKLVEVSEVNDKMKKEFCELQNLQIEKEAQKALAEQVSEKLVEVQSQQQKQQEISSVRSSRSRQVSESTKCSESHSRKLSAIENALLGIKEQILECTNNYSSRTEEVLTEKLREALSPENRQQKQQNKKQKHNKHKPKPLKTLDLETSHLISELNLTSNIGDISHLSTRSHKDVVTEPISHSSPKTKRKAATVQTKPAAQPKSKDGDFQVKIKKVSRSRRRGVGEKVARIEDLDDIGDLFFVQ